MKILTKSKLTNNQSYKKTYLNRTYQGDRIDLIVKLQYDDACGNGHNTFSITADVYYAGKRGDRNTICCGCCHDIIKKVAPELKNLIKWHLMSSDEPLHYVANTMYHAIDKDYNGLRKGEYSAFKKMIVSNLTKDGKNLTLYTTDTMYYNKRNNPNLLKSNKKRETDLKEFILNLNIDYVIVEVPCEYSISEGKESNLEAARSCAIWEDATLEQLQDKQLLLDRLPILMEEFKDTMKRIGFIY